MMAQPEGLLMIDKPTRMTSHDVVQVVRRTLRIRRVGHTGTLDPMARGLLIALVGRATTHQRALQGHDKTYEAVLQLGIQTDTADGEGKSVRQKPVPTLTAGRIRDVLASFEGALTQIPPAYSAVKIRGRPSYWWTRRNQVVDRPSRTVQVRHLELLDHDATTITFRTRCSAGTYVRTLAESIAEQLGTVGHLASLVRRKIGEWSLEDAYPLSWIQQVDASTLGAVLRPVAAQDHPDIEPVAHARS